ncbi:peptidyl-prolyl cis-trans isomerase [Pseudaestuariivita sp.]|uniref:peptidyl-prolyl cis-trans isomerase n=1 Tax=Pseudaestuariivita sp. TaxID=2211669 RepID=UPI0040592B45
MAKPARNSVSKTFVWIIVGLLCFAMIGFGAAGVGGTVRTIGSVGDRPIAVQDYVRAIQSEMRAFQQQSGTTLTFQQAQAFGVDQRALQQLVTSAALEHEAAELGLSVGDENLREQILSISSFQGIDGNFDREAYRFALENAGVSESVFEDNLRAESARTLLQGAVLSATPMPQTYGTAMVNFIGEARDFTWAEVGAGQLETAPPAATDAQLQAFYDENIAAFTLPETKAITYAWLTPDMIVDEMEAPEDQLRALYEERSAEFNQPERRLIERLAFLDDAAAEEARSRIDDGQVTFDDLVTERGLSLDDVDLGDVMRSELPEGAQEAVFEAVTGTVVGPVPSDFGPALYRVNAVLAAQETPFEEARVILAEDVQRDRARRLVEAQVQNVEDLLAGGATLEELGSETDMQTGTIDWTRTSDEGIAGYDAFASAARAAEVGDFPELGELSDGGLFALRVNEVIAPRPEPFDAARPAVEAAWREAETLKLLEAEAEALAAQLREGRTFEGLDLAPNRERDALRRAFLDGAPVTLVETAFELERGAVTVLTEGDAAYILRLDEVIAPDLASEESTQLLETVTDQMSGSIAQDLFQALAQDVQQRAGITLDQSAVNAVHAQFP